jgi:hypothetical protein
MAKIQIPFKAYSGDKPYIFVSYAHVNKDIVFPLIKQLHDKGYRVWYDEGIDPSTEWRKIITEHLMPATAVLVFLSPEAVNSKFVNREVSLADEENIPIVPVLLKETELTKDLRLTLTLLQRIDYFNYSDDEAFFVDLLRAPHLKGCFESSPSPPPPPPPPPPSDGKSDIEKGHDFYKKGNYTEAVNWFRKAAEQGLVAAQCNLGLCYALGRGVAKDESEGVNWFRKAAEQGHARAQYYLGVCYERGRGVAKDESEAVNWYRKAAEQGDVFAVRELKRRGISL